MRTKMRLSQIENRGDRTELRLKRIECQHERQEFADIHDLMGCVVAHARMCKSCGARLEVYTDLESFLAAKLEHAEEEFIKLRQELDKERSANDRKAKKAKA